MQLLTDLSEMVGGASFVPQTVTQTGAGTVVDMGLTGVGEISLNAILEVGAFGTNTTSITVQVEECATTNGTFTAVNNANGGTMVFSAVTTSNQRQVITGQNQFRYVRANVTGLAATTSSVAISVEILAMPRTSGGSTTGYSRSPSA